MAGIQRAAAPPPNLARVGEILAAPDWSNVDAVDHKKFWLLRATFNVNGQTYSQTGRDPVAMAQAMEATARATILPPRKIPTPAPEPSPVAPLGYADEGADDKPEETKDEGEPLPDALARLVPDTVEQAAHKKWLHDRWMQLGHKIQAPHVFGAVSLAEIREHEELERYRGLFT